MSSDLRKKLKDYVRHRPLPFFLYNLGRVLKGQQIIFLDYPVEPLPRYGYGKPPHPRLYQMMNRERESYRATLEKFLEFRDHLLAIPLQEPPPSKGQPPSGEPCWSNTWLPPLDVAALYCLVALNHPRTYLEVGSGQSTRLVRRAVRDHGLRTRVVSIDPAPRAEVDQLCDTVIRQPLERADLSLFEQLAPGDLLFVDSSHRCFMNSDVTVIFLEILPRLQPGILVHFHDVFLPYDYPPEWRDRWYSEQYLLAAMLLAQQGLFRIALPNAFVSEDAELRQVLAPLWNDARLAGLGRPGVPNWGARGMSLWVRTS